jgi:uncharacterized membrane protein
MPAADRGAVDDRATPDPAEDHGLERIVFLSDGLFAIALTILVIELRVPELGALATSGQLIDSLRELVPRLFAYALSFGIISLYWMAHVRRFKLIERADTGLAYLNLVLLALIALIPFPTSLIGQFGDQPVAVAIYAITLSAAGLAGVAGWVHASRAGLLATGAPSDLRRSGAIRGLAVPCVMLASLLLLPFASPYLVEISWILILPVQWLLTRPRGSAASAKVESQL